MNPYYYLIIVGIIPIITSIALYYFFKTYNISYLFKQLIVGLLFGIIAISGTEFGVPMNGAVINARDAAPLCAGLIFGAPAGLLAGFIGGIERWYAVYWGAGYYTRLACTISTCLTGIIGAWMKKNVYEDRIPQWYHALLVGIIAEVIHMLMIFVTNMSDIQTAFSFVEACSIPMITINSISVALATFFINKLDTKNEESEHRQLNTISSQFQKFSIWVVMVGFFIAAVFNTMIQNRLAFQETFDLLRLNIDDVVDELKAQADEALLSINRVAAKEIENNPDIDIFSLKSNLNVSEINIIDDKGYIIASTEVDNLGYDMSVGKQSSEFMCLLQDSKEFVQEFGPISIDSTIFRKYAGIAIDKGFVQVGYGEQEFKEDLANRLSNIATYRHIGETGNMMVVDSSGNIISNSFDDETNTDTSKVILDPQGVDEYVLYKNQDFYYMFTEAESFRIYAILPVKEADFSKHISIYLNAFLQTIVFGALFVAIYYIIKQLIVANVHKINDSLSDITDGKLDTVVDVKNNEEFIMLSDGINTTVTSLKHFINEANTRIDNELKYAEEIQTSALPSRFPAFPSRDEFDIYALMDPAKQVGGDFYDFYMIGRHTLVFLVADVAGKGIPASLFMMRAKTLLKTYAENRISVADIFTNANYQLCEGNDAGMFVTAWMGFLNLETGELQYANAGHNKPLLRRKDGKFEYLQGPSGFILAGMEGIVYKQQSIMLEPGDEIFLYTDGVVEATNLDKQLYGDDRLKQCLDQNIGSDAMTLCNNIKQDVDNFYLGAEQFDDITELSLQFKKYTVIKDKK